MRPPQHRIDAEAIYIMPDDPAWDSERLDSELKEVDDPASHPWRKYLDGHGRFDLHQNIDGHTPAEYIRPDGEPIKYRLRRMGPTNFARVQDMISRELAREDGPPSLSLCWLEAAKCSVAGIEGDGAPAFEERNGKLTESCLQGIMDHCGGMDGLSYLGMASWTLSKPLTDAEKKR